MQAPTKRCTLLPRSTLVKGRGSHDNFCPNDGEKSVYVSKQVCLMIKILLLGYIWLNMEIHMTR